MEVIYERCCGLDIHKKSVTACVLVPGRKEIRSFGTMTEDLLQLSDWLIGQGVTHVAMESTGVCWKAASSCCWSMPSISKQYQDVRQMYVTPNG